MRKLKNILVTGGAGFIGCNFIHYLMGESTAGGTAFTDSGFDGTIVNVDCLTYAGNAESLKDIEQKYGGKRYFFEKVDICDRPQIERILKQYDIDTIIHFAAESHVDRSILGPEAFMRTNVMGTFTLLDCARNFWKKEDGSIRDDVLFHHISTDEVYGSLGETGYFLETTPYDPRSPYSSSKASSDHIVMAYFHTYGLPITLSNCTNNYGPFQFPEKLLPLMISNIKDGKNLPVYGDGKNIRDWIYVEDHNRGVWQIVKQAEAGSTQEISQKASLISAHACVREMLLDMQRDLANAYDVVMDGRDIGTVVLPKATVKIFLTASAEVRAKRRCNELLAKGQKAKYETVLKEIQQRDYQDTHREIAPLKMARDSIKVDTSEMTVQQAVSAIRQIVQEKIGL